MINAPLIKQITVERLFGLYTYGIPTNGALTNASVLYGDNGVGKSTLLRLVFHLLSAASDRGHRTSLYKADFERLVVTLHSGYDISAEFEREGQARRLILTILHQGDRVSSWSWHPEDRRLAHAIRFHPIETAQQRFNEYSSIIFGTNDEEREKEYFKQLKEISPTLFLLSADRRLDCDSIPDMSDEIELRRFFEPDEAKRIKFGDVAARSREIALSQALNASATWIRRKALIGSNQGAMNVHAVYEDVVKQLRSHDSSTLLKQDKDNIRKLIRRLQQIDTKTSELEVYEMATHLSTTNLQRALNNKSANRSQLAANLLQPYVESVESRLEALNPTYQLTHRFINIVNSMLYDKSLTFSLSNGFEIVNRVNVTLRPSQLSSGEQQLLLLFCYVLTARDQPTVFMIDEPELSLNIKWQRKLIQSLLDITDGQSIQFVLASHSIELMAEHRSRIVKLVNRVN